MMGTCNCSSEGAMPMVFITEPNSYQHIKTTLSVSDIRRCFCLGGNCSVSIPVKQAEGVPHLVHLGSIKPGVHVVPSQETESRLTRSAGQSYF